MSSAAAAAAGQAPAGRPVEPATRRLSAVPRRQLRPARAPFVGLVVGLLAAALMALLLMNTQIARNSFLVNSLQQKNAQLDVRQQQLQQGVDAQAAPNALAARASRLGLVPAGQPAFIELPDGKVLGVPAPAVKPKPIRIKGVGPGAAATSAPTRSVGPSASATPSSRSSARATSSARPSAPATPTAGTPSAPAPSARPSAGGTR